MTLRRGTVVLICSLVTLAGCSGGGPSAPTAPLGTDTAGVPGETVPPSTGGSPGVQGTPGSPGELPPACDLLTAEEVQAVVGGPVEESASGGANCFWSPPEGEAGLAVMVSLVPLAQQDCLDFHGALAAAEVFDYEGVDEGVSGFWAYSKTLSETYVGGYELCTPLVNVGVRVESAAGAPADEAGQRAMADELVPLVLDRFGAVGD